tara:strand:- start:755 stop:1282 length:528 start_codon:yes stop_codon:yes gene_type:complete
MKFSPELTAQLLAEAATIGQGHRGDGADDVKQEYLALRLAGETVSEAKRLSGGADPLATRNKQRGPLVAGQRPIVSDFAYDRGGHSDLRSSTMDNRTDAERRADWDGDDSHGRQVTNLLSQIPAAQAEAIRLVHGIGTGRPLSRADAAEAAGVTVATIAHRVGSARKNLARLAVG